MNRQEIESHDTAAQSDVETHEPGPEGISSTGTTEILPGADESGTTAATEGTSGDAGGGTTNRADVTSV